jgi:hypothetical protein
MSKWLDNTNKWMDAPKKWERGSEKWLENSEMILVQDDLNSGLADAADSLAANSLVMDYYSHFESGKYHFFFSPNPHLELATKKPKQFSSWDDWDNILSQNQKKH